MSVFKAGDKIPVNLVILDDVEYEDIEDFEDIRCEIEGDPSGNEVYVELGSLLKDNREIRKKLLEMKILSLQNELGEIIKEEEANNEM